MKKEAAAMKHDVYTPEERKQIAAQIRAYMREGKVHSVQQVPSWIPTKADEIDVVEVIRPAGTADLQWMDMVARDVEGLIDHES